MRPNRDTSTGRDSSSEDMSATSGAGVAGKSWNWTPPIVSLATIWQYAASGLRRQDERGGM